MRKDNAAHDLFSLPPPDHFHSSPTPPPQNDGGGGRGRSSSLLLLLLLPLTFDTGEHPEKDEVPQGKSTSTPHDLAPAAHVQAAAASLPTSPRARRGIGGRSFLGPGGRFAAAAEPVHFVVGESSGAREPPGPPPPPPGPPPASSSSVQQGAAAEESRRGAEELVGCAHEAGACVWTVRGHSSV